MIPFIIRRLLWMVVLLLVISFLTYVIFYTLPSADRPRYGRGASRRRSS
jgi:ABC-type antimicrobial peptide transport system permease subunit